MSGLVWKRAARYKDYDRTKKGGGEKREGFGIKEVPVGWVKADAKEDGRRDGSPEGAGEGGFEDSSHQRIGTAYLV